MLLYLRLQIYELSMEICHGMFIFLPLCVYNLSFGCYVFMGVKEVKEVSELARLGKLKDNSFCSRILG